VDDATRRTIEANRQVHGALVSSGEYERSPHFRPENVAKVQAWVDAIAEGIEDRREARAIDLGCGTGFMIDRLRGHFAEVHGVDVTRAMMDRIDLSTGNIFLHEAMAESVPLPDCHFAFATAYSFLDHLRDVGAVLREVHRLLRPGGTFFAGLNPNRAFIRLMEQASALPGSELHPVYGREIVGALENGRHYEEAFGIDPRLLDLAEPGKSEDKGFNADEFARLTLSIGFRRCEVRHDWFLGQALLLRRGDGPIMEGIDRHLRDMLPLSSPWFKYLNFTVTK
jgi:SAM-dependent methyltransferase